MFISKGGTPFQQKSSSHTSVSHLITSVNYHGQVIFILNAGVLFTGKGKEVLDKNGQKIVAADGTIRVGKGFEENTFRKVYHGIKTLHKHFQRDSTYQVKSYSVCMHVTALM